MAGALPLGAKVSESFDQTSAKKLFPKAIDDHTGDKRMAGVGKPVGQPQPVAGLVGGQAGKDRGHVRLHFLARLAKVAAHEYVGRFAGLHLDHYHGGRERFIDLLEFFPSACYFGLQHAEEVT